MMGVFNLMNFMLLESVRPSKTKSQTARQAARSIEVCMKKLGFRPKNIYRPGFDYMAPLAGSLSGLELYALVPSWKGVHALAKIQPT